MRFRRLLDTPFPFPLMISEGPSERATKANPLKTKFRRGLAGKKSRVVSYLLDFWKIPLRSTLSPAPRPKSQTTFASSAVQRLTNETFAKLSVFPHKGCRLGESPETNKYAMRAATKTPSEKRTGPLWTWGFSNTGLRTSIGSGPGCLSWISDHSDSQREAKGH